MRTVTGGPEPAARGAADLSDPLSVSGQGVEAGTGCQGPDLHTKVCRATDQQVEVIIVVQAEDWREKSEKGRERDEGVRIF